MCDVLHLVDMTRLLNDSFLLLFVGVIWNEKIFTMLPKGKVNSSKEMMCNRKQVIWHVRLYVRDLSRAVGS